MPGKRKGRAAQLSPEERKGQLLRCAMGAFATKGLGRANHALVAQIGGVAVPTVFAYFPTREQLVEEVLAEVERVLLGIVRTETLNAELTAFERLRNLLKNYIDLIDTDPDLVKVFLDWNTCFEASLAEKFHAYLDKLIPLLEVIIEDGRRRKELGAEVNPVDAALMIFSSANVLAQIKFYNYEVDAMRYVMSVISSVLHMPEDQLARAMNAAPETARPKTRATARPATVNEQWAEHRQRWQQSSLSQAAYCREHDLSPSTFSYWLRKLQAAG